MSWIKMSTGGGKSNYDLWLEEGNVGSFQDFLNTLKGPAGTILASSPTKGVMPLYLPSADKFNFQYHPTVLFFSSPWNGYKYWMATTPWDAYTNMGNYKDQYENPHIYASKDGLTWVVPNGLVNPIAPLTTGGTSFQSDPHLVYRQDLNRIECWYRWTNSGSSITHIMRRTSTNGINWSEAEVMIAQDNPIDSGISTIVRSQSVIWDNTNSIYMMWYGHGNIGSTQMVYAESSDGKRWTNLTNVVHANGSWHHDVFYNNGVYYLTTYNGGTIRLFRSTDKINFTLQKVLLTPSGNYEDFYSKELYRAVLVKTDVDWRLYFTGQHETGSGIGIMRGETPTTMNVISGDYNWRRETFKEGIEIVNNGRLSSVIKLADTGECFGFDYTTKEPYFQKADGTKIYFTRT